MKGTILLTLLVLFMIFIFYIFYTNNNVIITKENYDNNGVNINQFTGLLLFYANWCPHCHSMLPEWEKTSKKSKNIKLFKIDCALKENEKYIFKYNLKSFPTIKFIKEGKDIKTYEGSKTAKGFLDFINKFN